MTDFQDAPAPLSDQGSAESMPGEGNQQEPLALRRIRKLRRAYPEATPAEIAEHIEKIFLRDFTLIGGTETGVKSVLPGALTAATSRGKLGIATQAAGHLGVFQGVSGYAQKAAQGIETSAKVGFSQSIKTYAHALSLLTGMQVSDAEDAASQLIGADVHQLLRTMSQPIAYTSNQPGARPVNVVAAISTIGLRNPQMLLLAKSGEQLVRSGGSVVASSKAHREFAAQVIQQVRSSLEDFPSVFPEDLASNVEEKTDTSATTSTEVAATDSALVQASSTEEIRQKAQENTASVRGAKLAARAFFAGSEKLKGWGKSS